MRDQELRSLCKKLRPLIGLRAEALWSAYLTSETPRAKQETESLIQMVAIQFLGNTAADTQVLLPPAGAGRCRRGVPVGKHCLRFP